MSESQRNLLILVVIAVAGALFSGAFNVGAGLLGLALNIAFTIAIAWFLVVLYRRHSGTIATMPQTPRLVMQASGVAVLFLLVAGSSLFVALAPGLPLPFGLQARAPVVYWSALLLCGFGIWWSWQQRTSRW